MTNLSERDEFLKGVRKNPDLFYELPDKLSEDNEIRDEFLKAVKKDSYLFNWDHPYIGDREILLEALKK